MTEMAALMQGTPGPPGRGRPGRPGSPGPQGRPGILRVKLINSLRFFLRSARHINRIREQLLLPGFFLLIYREILDVERNLTQEKMLANDNRAVVVASSFNA